MEWYDIVSKWWALILIGIAIITSLARYTIKIHKATEELKRVSKHDNEIKAIKDKTSEIETATQELRGDVQELRKTLKENAADQKADIRILMSVLFSIMDFLQKDGDDKTEVIRAHNELRDRIIQK